MLMLVKSSESCTKYAKAKIDWFEEVKTESRICEIVRPMAGTMTREEVNYTCGMESCIKWCEVNTACTVVMYKEGYCKLMAVGETTDTDEKQYNEYKEYRVFKKYGRFELPYYSSKCSDNPRKNCFGECRWSKGKPGYNRPIYGGFEGKWCGRVKCS